VRFILLSQNEKRGGFETERRRRHDTKRLQQKIEDVRGMSKSREELWKVSLPVRTVVITTIVTTRWTARTPIWPWLGICVFVVTRRWRAAGIIRIVVWAAWRWWIIINPWARRRGTTTIPRVTIVITAGWRRALPVMATRAVSTGWTASVVVIHGRISTTRGAGPVRIAHRTLFRSILDLGKVRIRGPENRNSRGSIRPQCKLLWSL
jgi:hypothetical protein